MFRRVGLGLVTATAALGCLLAPRPAEAGGRVLTASGSALFVRAARIAQARSPKWTTEWLSLDLDGGPGRVVLVLPVPAGTKVDPALDAFFWAIEASTAPRIRPPKPVLACGATHEDSLENTSSNPSGDVAPSTVAVLDDLVQLSSFATQQGVAFEADDAAKLGSDAASRFVAIVYDLTQGAASTETLRAILPVAGAGPGIALLASDDVPDVTLFSIAEGRLAFAPGIDEISAPELGSEWQVLAGKSSYVGDRRSTLLAAAGGVAVIESSGSTPLFGWNVLPGGAGALAPGVRTYFERAKKEAAGISSPDLCVEPVWDAIAAGKTGARLSRVCAAGSLVVVPDVAGSQACDEVPAAGEISAAALRCGEADDVAFALSGMRADRVRITRHTTVAGPQTPAASAVTVVEGATVSLLVTAASANTAGCVNGNGGASGGTTGGAGYAGYGGAGGYGASTGYDPAPIPAPEPRVDVQCWAEVGDSCSGGGGGADEGGSCDGDSSSDSEGDTCSGDSSSDETGDSCGGDSSGNADGDTCSGDSSSGAEGDTCSGGDAGGGDSCGSGSSGGESCSVPRRPRKLRVSALSLLFAAIALPLRRLGRRRGPRA